MSAKYHKIFFNKSPISAEPIQYFVPGKLSEDAVIDKFVGYLLV